MTLGRIEQRSSYTFADRNEGRAMNETVKAALLAERANVRRLIADQNDQAEHFARMLAWAEDAREKQRRRLADLDAALTEAGVDLAVEDARFGQGGSGRSDINTGLAA